MSADGSTSPVVELRPNPRVAIWLNVILTQVLFGIPALVAVVGLAVWVGAVPAVLTFAGWAGLSILHGAHLVVAYRKSFFRIENGRFVAATGGLLSNSSVELAGRNVTLFSYEQPLVERMLFGTGTVRVEAAGSGGSEIVMFNVDQPETVFRRAMASLCKAGFALNLDERRQEHRISAVGFIIDMVSTIGGVLLVILYIMATLGTETSAGAIVMVVVGLVAGAAGIGIVAARFLDLRNRRYRLYGDAVDFEEGFLTTRRTIIPMENVADSEAEQSVLGRIASFWDVRVSCQGAHKEVRFKYLHGGRELMEGLDRAVEELHARLDGAQEASTDGGSDGNLDGAGGQSERISAKEGARFRRDKREHVRGDRTFTGDFRQHLPRAVAQAGAILVVSFVAVSLMGLLAALAGSSPGNVLAFGLLAFGVAVAAAFFGAIRATLVAYMTDYRVTEDSVVSTFSFIITKRIEFSCDKITSVVLKSNPMDWLFGTATIALTSIGSAQKLEMAYQVEPEALAQRLHRKMGIDVGKAVDELHPSWSPSSFLRSPGGCALFLSMLAVAVGGAMLGTVSVVAAIIVMLVAGGLVAGAGLVSRVAASFRCLAIASDHVAGREGIVFRRVVTVPLRYVKGLKARRYLVGEDGCLTVDIAGELLVVPNQQEKDGKSGSGGAGVALSHGYTLPYLPQVLTLLEGLDAVVAAEEAEREALLPLEREQLPPSVTERVAPLVEARPSVGRLVIPGALVIVPVGLIASIGALVEGVVIVAVLAPIIALAIIALSIAQTRVITYAVDRFRVRRDRGLFFRARTTVAFRHVDFIAAHQGPLCKIFGVGTLLIHTTGSSGAEIAMVGFERYEEFHRLLKEHY